MLTINVDLGYQILRAAYVIDSIIAERHLLANTYYSGRKIKGQLSCRYNALPRKHGSRDLSQY